MELKCILDRVINQSHEGEGKMRNAQFLLYHDSLLLFSYLEQVKVVQ